VFWDRTTCQRRPTRAATSVWCAFVSGRIVADVASDHVVGDERVELPSDALMLHVDAAAELVAMPSSPNDTENASAFWLFQPSWTSP